LQSQTVGKGMTFWIRGTGS